MSLPVNHAIGITRAATVTAGWLQPLLILRCESILWICVPTSMHLHGLCFIGGYTTLTGADLSVRDLEKLLIDGTHMSLIRVTIYQVMNNVHGVSLLYISAYQRVVSLGLLFTRLIT